MIFKVMNDLRSYLQTQLPKRKFQLNYLPGRDFVTPDQEDTIYLTLLNISEDTSSKVPYSFHQEGNRFSRENPPSVLDLSIMISSFFNDYEDGLNSISEVISKLDSKRKFTLGNLSYTISLQNISMEENSNLWRAISTNILPNVIYKVRFISQNPENPEPDEKPIITI